jgi:hypothetical protein
MTAVATMTLSMPVAEPPAITLPELIRVLSELTEDENEIVGTLLHMVERGSVRLLAPGTATAI